MHAYRIIGDRRRRVEDPLAAVDRGTQRVVVQQVSLAEDEPLCSSLHRPEVIVLRVHCQKT